MNLVFSLVIGMTLLLNVGKSYALEWSPEFDSSQVRQPLETFQIGIPQSVSLEVLLTLALELDNIDVTAMVTRQGGFAIFTPVTPLEPGQHELRLVEYADDGSIIERGYWLFDIRKQSGLSESEFSADIYLAATSRVSDKNLTQPQPQQTVTQGSVSFNGKAVSEDWTFSGNLDLLYNGQQDPLVDNDELELGGYLLAGESTTTQFNIGHHSLAQTSLAMEGFYRRGVSISRGLDDIDSAITGFVLRSEDINGFQHGLGISDAENAVLGGIFEKQLLNDDSASMYVSATYLTGESQRVGVTVGALPTRLKGNAWAFVTDSTMFDQQLRFRAEFASSVTDVITQDTTDIDLIGAKGDAYTLLLSYAPQWSQKVVFNTGVELSQVDPLYQSIANPNLPNDKKLERLFFNADWLGLGMQFSTAKEIDNIGDDATRPQIETLHHQVGFNFGLTQMPVKGSVFDVLGLPTFSVQWDSSQQEQIKASNLIQTAQDLSVEGHVYSLRADFNKQDLSWGALYSDSQQEDKIDKTRRSNTKTVDVHTSFQALPSVLLSPSWSNIKTRYLENGERIDSDTASLIAQLNLSQRLNGQVLISETKSTSDSSVGTQDNTISTVSVQFRWQWIEPKTNKPGFDISVSGTQQDVKDNLFSLNNIEVNQVFLTLEMTLPLATTK